MDRDSNIMCAGSIFYLGGDEELLAGDDALLDGHLDTLSNLDLVTVIAGTIQKSTMYD
jgi:hypothetical protein